jgi:hypothetical protein
MPEEQRFQCRHILSSGHRCQSPCLRLEEFCYHHHTTRKPVKHLRDRRRRANTFTLPRLEDATSIQLAISEVLERVAANQIDPRRAGLLLYGLQIARANLPKDKRRPDQVPETVVQIVEDPTHGTIAPKEQYEEPELSSDPAERKFRAPGETGRGRYFEDILMDLWRDEKELEARAKLAEPMENPFDDTCWDPDRPRYRPPTLDPDLDVDASATDLAPHPRPSFNGHGVGIVYASKRPLSSAPSTSSPPGPLRSVRAVACFTHAQTAKSIRERPEPFPDADLVRTLSPWDRVGLTLSKS